MSRYAFIMPCAVILAACGAGHDAEPPSPSPTTEIVSETTTDGKSWLIEVRYRPSPPPLNEHFELDVLVRPSDRVASAPVHSVSVDADMPEHGHGMNTAPVVTGQGASWTARGMLFHMPGDWEVYVDVTGGDGRTERATFAVKLTARR